MPLKVDKVNTAYGRSKDYVVIMPAYNEEKSILQALDALSTAAKNTKNKLVSVIICINGCTDKTESLARTYTKLPVEIIKSSAGYLPAMNRLILHARRNFPGHRMLKTDADSILAPDALAKLFVQLDKHSELIVAGGHPMPVSSGDLPMHLKLSGRMLSIRNRYPLSEMAASEVSIYHPLVDTDPQTDIGQAEKQTKVYFHGRLWCARDTLDIPPLHNNVIGDDVYLNDYLYIHYGYQAVRVIYGANCYFKPYHSLGRHWKVYKRIHEDKERVRKMHQYEHLHDVRRTKLNWRYILTSVPAYDIPLFAIYGLVRRIEEFSFRHTAYRAAFWQYTEKES